ncbi:hypothetical protein [uncultured Chryseobacterium sp.]|uniref:hypothetical protein n=1 Tax=uncultured Chryseobacterium sp. TaxID=259322 RepID=UPI0025FB373B|nr:hypothetical protein [uncultured Chryseobacterium sp.]
MKTLLTTALSVLGFYGFSQSNIPVGSNLPTVIETPDQNYSKPHISDKGYSNAPNNIVDTELYKPKYEDKVSKYVRSISETKNDKNSGGGTLDSIININNNEIDIGGGYVRANEAYITEEDGTLTPKYDVYKQGVNNEEYNKSIKEQEVKANIKSVKNASKEILPLILMLIAIIALVYLIVFLHKKMKTKSM